MRMFMVSHWGDALNHHGGISSFFRSCTGSYHKEGRECLFFSLFLADSLSYGKRRQDGRYRRWRSHQPEPCHATTCGKASLSYSLSATVLDHLASPTSLFPLAAGSRQVPASPGVVSPADIDPQSVSSFAVRRVRRLGLA